MYDTQNVKNRHKSGFGQMGHMVCFYSETLQLQDHCLCISLLSSHDYVFGSVHFQPLFFMYSHASVVS